MARVERVSNALLGKAIPALSDTIPNSELHFRFGCYRKPGLPVHAARPRRIPALVAIQDQRQRKQPTRNGCVR